MKPLHALTVVTALILLQGCAIWRNEQSHAALASPPVAEDIETSVEVWPTPTDVHIPHLWHWQNHEPPYDIVVVFKGKHASYASVSIQSVRVDYDNAESVHVQAPQNASFSPATHNKHDRAELRFRDLLTNPADGSIVITGELRTLDGASRPFQTEHHFTIESNTQFLPYYFAMLMGV